MTYQAVRGNSSSYMNVGRATANAERVRRDDARRARSSAPNIRREREAAEARRARAAAEQENARRRARAEYENARRMEMLEREIRAQEMRRAQIAEYEKRVKREHREARRAAKLAARAERRREEKLLRRREIKVKRVKLPMNIVLSILIAFVMLCGVAYSATRVAVSTYELSKMQNELSTVREDIERYRIKLEQKNDLGEIEKLAVDELNMVKEDSVQKKYITVSDGERIVLENDDDNSPENYGGILSGLASVFDGILDYIR